jgi:hypothetical protein
MMQFLNEAAPLSAEELLRGRTVISNQRYFERRASEEAARAARAMSADAKLWHRELAEKFSRLAKDDLPPQPADRRFEPKGTTGNH